MNTRNHHLLLPNAAGNSRSIKSQGWPVVLQVWSLRSCVSITWALGISVDSWVLSPELWGGSPATVFDQTLPVILGSEKH